MLIILCVCCAFAELAVSPENVPKPITARQTPVRTANSPIKTRRLKNADCEVDFCFIVEFELSFAFWFWSFNDDPRRRQRAFCFSSKPGDKYSTIWLLSCPSYANSISVFRCMGQSEPRMVFCSRHQTMPA